MLPKSWESCLAAAQLEFEIIEADFQQYYGLELESLLRYDFARYCRLLLHLPFESRFIQAHCTSKDWDWDKEVQSRILHALDTISCQLANIVKKEGRSPAKPRPQFQPDYVKKAKETAERSKQIIQMSSDELEDMEQFWQEYNHNTKRLESGNQDSA